MTRHKKMSEHGTWVWFPADLHVFIQYFNSENLNGHTYASTVLDIIKGYMSLISSATRRVSTLTLYVPKWKWVFLEIVHRGSYNSNIASESSIWDNITNLLASIAIKNYGEDTLYWVETQWMDMFSFSWSWKPKVACKHFVAKPINGWLPNPISWKEKWRSSQMPRNTQQCFHST